jgi:hypothetical protein
LIHHSTNPSSLEQLAFEHAMKVKEYEVKQMIKAKERQAVFEQVFEADIQQYKTSGILPSKWDIVVFETNFQVNYSTQHSYVLNPTTSIRNFSFKLLPEPDLPRSGTTSLEEVVVEDVDSSALDQFLND